MAAVDVDVVRGLVEGALQRARSDAAQSDDRERSRAFVEALHEALWVHYRAEPDVIRRAEPDVIVMSRSCTSERDRKRMGMNELLHDITVCRIAPLRSVRRGVDLWCVREALWQVESELANNTREGLYDFNKLILGAARYKLFIGRLITNNDEYFRLLREAASSCTGEVFAALIPHPQRWNDCDEAPRVVRLKS
jgi:hypothetical protein